MAKMAVAWEEIFDVINEVVDRSEVDALIKKVREGENLLEKIEAFGRLALLVINTIEMTAEYIEGFYEGLEVQGSTKMRAAVEFLDGVIKLPFYLEWADNRFLPYIISSTVGALNTALGHEWVKKTREEFKNIIKWTEMEATIKKIV